MSESISVSEFRTRDSFFSRSSFCNFLNSSSKSTVVAVVAIVVDVVDFFVEFGYFGLFGRPDFGLFCEFRPIGESGLVVGRNIILGVVVALDVVGSGGAGEVSSFSPRSFLINSSIGGSDCPST